MATQLDEIEGLTRDALRDVFQSMLSLELTDEPNEESISDPDGQIVGSVGFAGASTGVIYLRSGIQFGKCMTSRMLGLSDEEAGEPEMMNDTIGELCNMVVGPVKSRLCDRGWPCVLSIPSIVRGQNIYISRSGMLRKLLAFRTEGNLLQVEILLKDSAK